MEMKKPVAILNAFFGRKPQQTMGEFATEVRALKQDEAGYREVVELAAAEIGVGVDWS